MAVLPFLDANVALQYQPLTMWGAALQNKAYSRDFLVRGRVRVQLKNEDGTLINPEFPNRKSLIPFGANWMVYQKCFNDCKPAPWVWSQCPMPNRYDCLIDFPWHLSVQVGCC